MMVLLILSVFLLSGLVSTSQPQYRFTQSSYNVTIPENSARDTAATSDQMMGMFGDRPGTNVSYRVVFGDPGEIFRVEQRPVGDFWFLVVSSRTGSLNRERKDKYVLTVNATVTTAQTAFETTANVVVNIIDTNDLSPLFYSPNYHATIPEDLPIHSSILKVFAEDADLGRNGEVYYSFVNVSEHFAVHPVTGVVTLMKPLTYTERSVYDLVVSAQDRGVVPRGGRKPTSRADVRITVRAVNLYGPEIYVYHLPEVSEHSHADVYAIIRVIDRDEGINGEVQSLDIVDGDEDGHFRISPVEKPSAGVKGEEFNIEILKLIDRTSFTGGYNLTLRAIDKGKPPRTTYNSIPFKLKDYYDNKPVFEREIYEIEVPETTPINSSVIRLKIPERDGLDSSQILLEIVGGNEAGEFRINSRTGVLYTSINLDAEKKTFYTLTVSAIDHGAIWNRKQSSAKVKIQVIDMNDNDPKFDSPSMDLLINEDEPAGTSVVKVTAKDRDSGENAYISYSIANLNSVPFEIDHFTGLVRTTKVLDYESMRRQYTLYVRASDWGTPYRRQSEMRLNIMLKDINDNKPLFEKTDCVGHLPREVPMDTEVITLSAIDLDAGNIISYRIASGNEDGCFSLDVTSGMLYVACDLTEIASSDRHINITAYDGTHFADFAHVHIKFINSNRPRDFLINGESASFNCKDLGVARRLTDVLALAEKNNSPRSRDQDEVTLPNRYGVNTHAPQFISIPHEIQVNESVPIGYSLIKIHAVDKDLGYNGKLNFGITSGDVDSTFIINEETGEIRISGYLDREYRDKYYLNITVFDLGQPQMSSSRMLSVVILDVNDNPPVFDKNVVSFRIREDTLSNTEIFQFRASDNDLGENSHLWYEIVTFTDNFKIDSRSGILSVENKLDRETQGLFELKIKASDRASDPNDPDALQSYALARVIVEDVNDEAPVFPSPTYLVKIREDLPVGTVVVTIDAWDPDLDQGGTVRYSFPQEEGLPFSVDRETGTIRTTAALDYEDRQVYTVVLRGEDLGVPALWSEVNLTIEITDVNENIHPPRFDDFAYAVRVRENRPPETLVATVRAVDADQTGEDSRVRYSIVGGSGMGLFTIDDKGHIWTETVLDRESTPHYWLSVLATDHGVAPLHSRAEVFVSVEDENDNVPLSEWPAYRGRVVENCAAMTPVLTVTAADADQPPGLQLRYSITGGNSAGHFVIDHTGLISTATDRIDREMHDEYVLEVTITDSGVPPLSSTAQVVIAVDDENDNSPRFDQTFYHVMIPERQHNDSTFIIQNEADASEADLEFEALFLGEPWTSLDPNNLTGYPVFRLLAVDLDTGANGRVEYQVKSSHGRFNIHPHTGAVYAQRPVIANHNFDLLVRASDCGSPSRRSTARVSVHVMGVQGGSDTVLTAPPVLHAQVTEDDPAGYLVAVIQPAAEENVLVWFSIVDGDPGEHFIIGVDSGSVQLARPLDCETQAEYNLTVSVTDGHSTALTQLIVEVIDSNEHRPQFSQPLYIVTVSEGAEPGTALVQLIANDSDVTDQLVYSLHNARSEDSLQLFSLDHLTGLLTLAQPLDREALSEHILTVVVSDAGTPVKRDFARVSVRVSDTNDHAPQWPGGVVTAEVLESAFPETRVVTVTARDLDHGENGALTYNIVSGNIGNFFRMDGVTGDISVSRELDCEVAAEFNLMVRAVDGGSPPLASTQPVFVTVRQSDHSPPRWEEAQALAEVPETVAPGWPVWQARARSALSLHYHLESGDPGGHFAINPGTGVVSTRLPLDYETTPVYNLTIAAVNLAGARSVCTLVVDVEDRNDHWPVFLQTEYRGRIAEDAAPGSLVLTEDGSPLVLLAHDRDSPLLDYDIVQTGPRRVFYIDSTTGALRSQAALDYEQQRAYTFDVQVRDRGTPQLAGRQMAHVTLDVLDVNDCPPLFGRQEYNVTVLMPNYHDISIVQVSATDGDSANLTRLEYSIVTGNHEHMYSMAADSGVLSLRNRSRSPHKSPHRLKVTVTDGPHTTFTSRSPHKSPHRLKVTVTDGPHTTFTFVNVRWEWSSSSSLRFQQAVYEAAVVENSTKVVTVAVVAVVGAELNEHLVFSALNPSPLFHVGWTSGAVRTTGLRFDRERADHYQLIVQARSELEGAGDEVRVAQTVVNVSVLDVNDNCPLFVGQPYYSTVPADATRGDVVTKVHAVDFDAGENGEVRYELMRGHGELFKVNRKTGEVILKQPLESQVHEYQLSIAAYDGGMTPCSTEVWAHLTVVDRSRPLFDRQFHTAVVSEDVAPHTVVPVSLNAHVPFGMKLFYTIVAGNEYELFSVDFFTGVLRVVDELDFEDAQEHSLTVRATNLHGGESAETSVKVKVTDVNDCYPEFTENIYRASVSESAAPGAFVIKITASDKDSGDAGVVRYALKTIEGNSSEFFTIEPEDGSVYLKKSLDRETQARHRLQVIATDSGLPNLSTTTVLWIKVLDTNDNSPQFSRSVFVSRLSTEAVRGQTAGRVTAWDPDHDTLHYSLVSRAFHHMFNVEPHSGIIKLIKVPKLESSLSVELNVSVSDGVHMSFCTAVVDLVWSDRSAPAFLSDHYEVTIPENIAEPSFLVLLSVDDPDTDRALTYSIPSEKQAAVIAIDPYTGMLKSRQALDREERSQYEVLVMCEDGSGHSSFTSVRLTVSDVNDNTPVFTLAEYTVCVAANHTINSAFLKVRATDADQGPAGQVVYTIYAAHDSDIHQLFSVHPLSGTIYLQHPALTLEGHLYQFFVRATDRGSPALHADVPVRVYILDYSEEPPVFLRTDESFVVPEDAPIGYNVTRLELSGPGPVDFQLLDPDSPFSMTVDGTIYLSGRLDRELSSLHTLPVAARARSSPVLTTVTSVTVSVQDVNDNRPVFHSRAYRARVAENVDIGTPVIQVEADDADEGRHGEVYYLLEGGAGLFSIDTFSGWVVTAGRLDRESAPLVTMTVVALDNGSPGLSASIGLIVELVDYNDNPPAFISDLYTVAVMEDTPEGAEVIRLEVTDPDSDSQLRFWITTGDPGLQFAMDEVAQGVMYLRRALDREARDRYDLTVVVSDSKYVATARVAVTVLDVNDEKPYCTQSRYYANLAENAAPGTYVLTVEVEDNDLEPNATFKLVGEGAEHFFLHKDKGELKTSKLLDRETMPKVSLKALVHDETFPDWDCVTFIEITVTDVNDNAPTFHQASHKVSLSEDSSVGTFITKINAFDLDRGMNRKIRYYLVNSGENHFEVSKDTAIVRLAKPLDRELQSMFTLIVKAVDSGMPQLWTLTTLQVIVLDVNDNPPEFVTRVYSVTVPENTTVDTDVVKVEAISKDTGLNAQVIYTIVEGNEQGKFALHPISGVLSMAQPVDYEQCRSYLLSILATDQGTPPLSSQATVNVTVSDSNDNAPHFSHTTYTVHVAEDTPVGDVVIKVEATDKDSGANARIAYTLEQGDNSRQFSLDLNTGELSVAKSLDRESIADYMLTVRAADFGSPRLSSTSFVSVTVLDVNDNAPTFTQDNYTFYVQEDKMPGWAVGQLAVSDADTFPNGPPFAFTILSGNPELTFRVVSDGTLYTSARLSTRTRALHYLQVRVTDSGFPPLHADTWVTVKVIEESQFAPSLSPLEVWIVAYQERWPGGEIGHVSATDRDPHDTLRFALEADSPVFAVDPRRGVLTAGPALDAGRYRLNVSATDGRFTSYTAVTVHVLPLWEDMLQHSVSIRLRSMTAHHFLVRQWRGLVQLLETALLRQVSLTSLQAGPHGDLDVLLTIAGGVELAVLSDALQSAGLSGANWTCDCLNGALCRQKVQIQRDLVFTVTTDYLSFVCPGHSHQLYCACNLGFAGEHCEDLLPAGECQCPAPQQCVPQPPPAGGYRCAPPTSQCPPSHSCPPPISASLHWEELVAVVVAVLIISCVVVLFVLYRRCHRISPGNRINKSDLNHVIKRTSKLSNLQVTQPSRPTSYTCSSNNELFSAVAVALNNVDSRPGGEADSVPADYRRNLMSPHHKINNDLKQSADIPMHQLALSDDETRTLSGYHWDCSDWLQNGDVNQTNLSEVPDSSSYHSNDSCQTGDPARELATLDTKLSQRTPPSSREDPVIPYGFPGGLDLCS